MKNQSHSISQAHKTKPSDKILFILAICALAAGWAIRNDKIIIAEEGLGYALGIVGGSLMLLLLLYPVRKKTKWMRNFGNMKYWFQLHMMFGVIGPVLVLYHANFHLGSMNSNVALYCMLLVACSGLVGRYFYSKVHYGLYGRLVNLKQLTDEDHQIRQRLKKLLAFSPNLLDMIEANEKRLMAPSNSFIIRVVYLLFSRPHLRMLLLRIKRCVQKDLKHEQKIQNWRPELFFKLKHEINLILDDHFELLETIAHFHFFERMLSLWHLFHYPFFLMMVISAIVHVAVVHVY